MSLHRRGKTDYLYIAEHFNSCCKGKSYSIQIIEDLSGNGHDENGFVYKNINSLELSREDFQMKILTTNFPYGLNERSKYLVPELPIGIKKKQMLESRNSQHCIIFFKNFNFF